MTYDLSETVSDGGIDDYPSLAALLNEFGDLGGIGKFMVKQATTQGQSITQQLDAGIRFLDFRIMYTDADWYCLHMMKSKKTANTYLNQVRLWLDAHTEEVIVIWLSKHGNNCAKGSDQYPGVSVDTKMAFWSQIKKTFQGLLLDTKSSPLNSTSLPELVKRNHRVVIYASDFVEFTGGTTTLATDACHIDNRLGMSDVNNLDLRHDLNLFNWMSQRLEMDKATGKFLLMSMACSPPASTIQLSAEIEFLAGATKNIPDCAKDFNITDMTNWCPSTLLDVSQLNAYYKQAVLDDAYNKNLTFPNAIYIDAVDEKGLIRTGTKLLSQGQDEPVCDIIRWTSCQTHQPVCDEGWTANGEYVHFNCYDYDGQEHGFCGLAWQNHYKCCRNTDGDHGTDGYAYVDTLLAYNVRKACASKPHEIDNCEKTIAMLEERRANNPLKLWDDCMTGRLLTPLGELTLV